MMQDFLLRVFVVALGLLMCPRDNPRVKEEWNDAATMSILEHAERLLREEEIPEQEVAPFSEEMTHGDDEEHEISVTKRDSEEDYADRTLPGRFKGNSDPSRQLKSTNEPEIALKSSQIDRELKENLQVDMGEQGEATQTGDSFRDPIGPQGQQEKPEEMQVFSSTDQEAFLSQVHNKMSKNKTTEKAITDWEEYYLWYIWNMLSVISMIRFFRKYWCKTSRTAQDEARTFAVTRSAAEVPLPDIDTLQRFHSQVSPSKKWREVEFLEGFAHNMVEAMGTICARNGGMVIEECQMSDACDIVVPFTPPKPYAFQRLLWNNQASDQLPDMQVCGQIKVVEIKKVQNSCHCQSTDADDTVCLLHCEDDNVETEVRDVCGGLLCSKDSPFLSKSQVTRWFQSTIKQAWAQISHQYEFELSIRYVDAPGALEVRFRSGKTVSFTMNPVVKFNAHAHFYITPCSPNYLDTFWPLSLTNYEDQLLEHISERLPEGSCHMQTLEIARFLHQRQMALSGGSALKNFHFKTALIHLLLTKAPSQWKSNHLAFRLRDLLDFVERSLEKKLLKHALIGNPLTQKIIQLPAECGRTKPVNLFHPLVVHDCIYRNAVMHFQEMLRNAHILIHDYSKRYWTEPAMRNVYC